MPTIDKTYGNGKQIIRETTWADRGDAANYPGEQVFFTDLGITAYSDNINWVAQLTGNEVAILNLAENINSIAYKDLENIFSMPQIFAADIKLDATGIRSIGSPAIGIKKLYVDYTNTATVGAVTINKASGRVNIAAAGTAIVITNSLVTAASHVFANISTADATAIIQSVVPSAGSFTINLSAAATGQIAIDFFVINAD